MAQEILNGGEIGIGIEQLGGHGMAKMMTRHLELGLAGISFHAPLNAADGDGLPLTRFLFRQEDLSGSGWRPHS